MRRGSLCSTNISPSRLTSIAAAGWRSIRETSRASQPAAAAQFQRADSLNFDYSYPILPEGLLPRFIVRTHHLSDSATRWKSGVIIRQVNSESRALIRADSAERLVRISIDGPESSRRELLAIVRHNFDAIHSDYKFTPSELVYAKEIPDKPLRLDELDALLKNGELHVPVVKKDRTVAKERALRP